MGMTMAQITYGNTGGEIQVFLAIRVPYLGPFSTNHFNGRCRIIGDQIFAMFRRDHWKSGCVNNLRTDPFIGKNFEENTVRKSAIDEVHPVDA